jgi:hypothetical protein
LVFLPNLFKHTDISDSLNKITVVALVATTFIQLISLRFIAELNGTGFIHISKLIDALTATLRIIGCAFVITFGGSYWAVAIVFLLVQLVQLVLLYISSRARRAKLEQPSSLKPVFNYIAPVTWRTAGVNTGTFFILYGANFFATLLEDVEEATSLMLSIRIALVLKQVAVMPMQIVTPKLALFFTRQQYKQATDIFIAAASIGMLTFILGSGVILLLGDEIISAISNNSLLLNKSLLGFLLFIFFLEVNHSLHGTFYVQSNHVPFLWASVISAISYLLLGYFFMADFGILGILCSLFISQLVVNNWLPLLYSRRLLSASLITVYIKIFQSWFVPGPFILLKKL